MLSCTALMTSQTDYSISCMTEFYNFWTGVNFLESLENQSPQHAMLLNWFYICGVIKQPITSWLCRGRGKPRLSDWHRSQEPLLATCG